MSNCPNFIIVGAPKAGTTSLYHYLGQHPEIFMSPVKEPHYFCAEFREENFEAKARTIVAKANRELEQFLTGPMNDHHFGGTVSRWEDYVRLFTYAGSAKAIGEATPAYLWSPGAAAAIATKIPHAKILILLRDPAERAFSHYHHLLANGAVQWSFGEHIRRCVAHRGTRICGFYPFLELGCYAAQVARYRAQFGKNVWIGFHDDYKHRPEEMFGEIFRLLEIAVDFRPDTRHRHLESQVPRIKWIGKLKGAGVWQAAARLTPKPIRPWIRRALVRKPGTTPMDPTDRRFLVDYYRNDIRKLESLIARDLSDWHRV
jgi:hypothetical protein